MTKSLRKKIKQARLIQLNRSGLSKMIAANAAAYMISDATPEVKIVLFSIIIIIVAVVAFRLKSR
jgi:hypothetical protein